MPHAFDMWMGVLMSAGFVGLIALAEAWSRLGNPPAEWTRKLVHVGGGLGCLVLPFVVESHWVVGAMALGLSGLFLAGRATGGLESLHGVGRASRGTEYFPLVVYALFLLTGDDRWLYVVSILVLAVADAAAALVGGRYGRIRYEVEDQCKSLEGSLAFATVTFVIILLPLWLWPDPALPPLLSCATAALLTALLVTAFEAVSLGGRDNLWVPLGTCLVLQGLVDQPLEEVVVQIMSFVAFAALLGLVAWRTRALNVGGALVFMLWAYGCWALGGSKWAAPVALGFVVYLALRSATREPTTVKVSPVVRSIGPLLLVLLGAHLARRLEHPELFPQLYGPFLAGCALVVMQIAWNRIRWRWRVAGPARVAAAAVTALGAWLIVAVPPWVLYCPEAPRTLVALAAITVGGGLLYDRIMGEPALVGTHARVGPSMLITSLAIALAVASGALSQ